MVKESTPNADEVIIAENIEKVRDLIIDLLSEVQELLKKVG